MCHRSSYRLTAVTSRFLFPSLHALLLGGRKIRPRSLLRSTSTLMSPYPPPPDVFTLETNGLSFVLLPRWRPGMKCSCGKTHSLSSPQLYVSQSIAIRSKLQGIYKIRVTSEPSQMRSETVGEDCIQFAAEITKQNFKW